MAGSVLFVERFEQWQSLGVWLFIVGSSLMLIGGMGRLLVSVWKDHH